MKNYKIDEIPYKRIFGRNVKDADKKSELNFFWAASALEIKVRAREVRAVFKADYSGHEIWVSVYVNHSEISRFMIENDGEKNICLIRNLDPALENVITIYKETQPMPGDEKHSLVIKEIILDDEGCFVQEEIGDAGETNSRVGEINSPAGEINLCADETNSPAGNSVRAGETNLCAGKNFFAAKRIEFIGDSITSGEGLRGCVSQMEWIPSFFSASKTYASQIARKLNCEFSCVSQSGWGLRWSWDGKKECSIPPFYKEVCSVLNGTNQKKTGTMDSYDFGRGFDYVVLNLGTNDNIALKLKGEDCSDSIENRELFVKTAIEFLTEIRKNNPSAKILWCYGMIKLDVVPLLINAAVKKYKEISGDKNAWTLELDSMEDVEFSDDDKGSRNHPGIKTHKLAAEKITKFLQTL